MTDVTNYEAQIKPCAECPWRTDVAPGQFPPERFVALAHTAYDMGQRIFTCHKSATDRPVICAGFLSRGADHNLSVRMAYHSRKLDPADRGGGLPLHHGFREMAIADGVEPHHPALADCRSVDG